MLPFLLRRLKEDVLADLPPKIIQDYHCDLSPLQVFTSSFYPKVLGRLRVLRVKTCKLRVTCKTCNPHRKMYGFTRNLPSTYYTLLFSRFSRETRF